MTYTVNVHIYIMHVNLFYVILIKHVLTRNYAYDTLKKNCLYIYKKIVKLK